MEPDPLQEFARARRRVSLALSSVMVAVYFGFILAAAFAKSFMAKALLPGLSWGILSGALVIVIAFVLTGIYVRATNRLDRKLHASKPEQS
jgi:putative solute:sodium symporter small subunit